MLEINKVHCMDVLEGLKQLDNESVHCCVTSPPYWHLRDYNLKPTCWPEVQYSPMAGLQELHIPGWSGCLGLEPTIEMFVGHIVLVFREVQRVLRRDGTLWLNFGDRYADGGNQGNRKSNTLHGVNKGTLLGAKKAPKGLKHKDLIGMPWRVAFALQADGWYLRSDIIWHKPSCMPDSVKDRPTKCHEYIFLFSKSSRYYYDYDAILEPGGGWRGSRFDDGKNAVVHPNVGKNRSGNKERKFGAARGRPESHFGASIPLEGDTRNKRTVWTIASSHFAEAHFATFPPKLIEPCILAGCPVGGVVLDCFMGSGTTGMVAKQLQRNYVGIEKNQDYIKISDKRTTDVQLKIV
jgi:DNA modification methylase